MQQATGTIKSVGYWAVVLTQALTMFNEHAFRVSIMLMAALTLHKQGNLYVSLANIFFLLPYALFSVPAGFASDRFSKRSVFVFWKWMEVPILAVALSYIFLAEDPSTLRSAPATPAVAQVEKDVSQPSVVQYDERVEEATLRKVWIGIGILFVFGMQAAFYSPSRYGILPEILHERQLSLGNGVLELGSYIGVISGVIASGAISMGLQHPHGKWGWAPLLIPGATILSLLSSLLIRKVPAANPKAAISNGFKLQVLRRNWNALEKQKGMLPVIAGLMLFWGMSTLYALNTLSYGKAYLKFDEYSMGANYLIVAVSIGGGIGAVLAGWISLGTVELALVPIASFLWFIFSVALGVTGLVAPDSFYWSFFWLLLSGVAAGLFVVPLNTYLEKYSPEEMRASCIATSNVMTGIAQVIAIAAHLAMGDIFHASPAFIFIVSGVFLLFSCYWMGKMMIDYLSRFAIVVLTRMMYRLRIVGAENVPGTGPALIVCNHVSFADGNLLTACFKHFVRFVVFEGHYDIAFLKWLGNVMKAIPIDPEAPPKQIVQALRNAGAAVSNGEILCIFAEGSISRIGSLLPFRRGFEQIVKRVDGDVPIIPAYIDGMWGSIFSFQGGRFFKKWPKKLRYPVTITFGKPLPKTATAFELREQVQLLSSQAFEMRKDQRRPLHRQFIHQAKKYARRPCAADSMTPTINYGKALMGSVIFSRILKRKLGSEKFVGLLVPPSVGGYLANIATSYLGKVPVNLNYSTGLETLNTCIKHAGIKQILASKKLIERLKAPPDAELIFLEELGAQATLGDKLAAMVARVMPAWFTEHWLLGLGKHSMDDLATIIFSSGSTAEPKGVMLTHQNIVANIEQVVQMIDADENDTMMGVLPFFHSFGYTGTLWLPPLIGAKSVYHFNPLDPEKIGEMIAEHKATLFLSTATFLRSYIRKCAKEQFQSVRLIVCGAEKLPVTVADQFEAKFGVRPMEGFGCTELSPAVSANCANVQFADGTQIAHKPGTIGNPMPGVSVKICDPTTNEKLPVGQEGLLWVKGPNVMSGYLGKPELTAEVIQDGWYNTGDIAKLDEDGFITITDRLSRFSKIGGEMVPHGKVEEALHEVLNTHEKVFAVAGVKDDRKGERLIVLHTPLTISAASVWEALKNKGLPGIWLPAQNSFFEIPEMPILATGKIDLRQIKKLAQEKANSLKE